MPAKKKEAAAVKVVDVRPAPAAPAAPAPAIGHNSGAKFEEDCRTMTALAMSEGSATEKTAAHIAAVCAGASDDVIRKVKGAACLGYIAATLGGDVVAAALLLRKASKAAEKPNTFGQRNAAEEAAYASANTAWSRAMDRARTMVPAGALPAKNTNKARPGNDNATKPSTAAGATPRVAKGRDAKAAGVKADQTTSNTPSSASPADAMAWLHQEAGRIRTFVEANKARFTAAQAKELRGMVSRILAMGVAK